MCGIVGAVSHHNVIPGLAEGLKRLEYRGYDSSGVATVTDGAIQRRRAEGKLANLETLLAKEPLSGHAGIGHTRWATHGAPTQANAHPHATDKVAVVHNGIIENFRELRAELIKKDHRFTSETDTEVIPVLITDLLNQGLSPRDAVQQAVARLHGAYALGILIAGHENLLFGARQGSPLAVGFGDAAMYLGSDALALLPFTRRVSYLDEGDVVELTREGASFFDAEGKPALRDVRELAISADATGKGDFAHYMLKEIHEQPTLLGETLSAYANPVTGEIALPKHSIDLSSIERLHIVACGTSYYAGMVAKYWLEHYARIPTEVDIASEFRYREPILNAETLVLCISQSGETADTLAGLRLAKSQGARIAAILNNTMSSMGREAELVLPNYAGPEIGVASTKAFTTQLVVLACLTLHLGVLKGTLGRAKAKELLFSLSELPSRAAEVLQLDASVKSIAAEVMDCRDVLYIARGPHFPIAMEGALKLKEISYIHAEAYAAGELKHGPIALIDPQMPIVALAPSGPLFEKTQSNMQEVAARGGKLITIGDVAALSSTKDISWKQLPVPPSSPLLSPILYALPVQLLAYHTAVLKGTDVDQPRNLAKSVTVE
ncbi:MAG: glutamine--fructose-6-phosphate transaminase (isomerizing) [Alphaproteobacteria bacterium]|nr:glutamine--fructose-6-phosphate transaminase (isomerizing) [Alphaproteobacteria bacterium]